MPYTNPINYENAKSQFRIRYASDPVFRKKILNKGKRYYLKHIPEDRERSRRYRLKNKERLKQINWKGRIKYDFGITPEEYNLLLNLQKGKCAICEKPPTIRRLDIDHNHSTGIIRGLLCRSCNRFLGIIENNIIMMNKLDSYLLNNPLGRVAKIKIRTRNGKTIFTKKNGLSK